MTERRILRIDGQDLRVATEARFESEERLHAAIARHPEVIPSEDLGMGPLVTLANELDLGHGPIDTLAADAQGRLVIIEFKRGTENPDVRKVVAQVLDYGSALWKTSYDDLEAVARGCRPGFEVMTSHVADRLAVLGVDTYDPDAFKRGVETCLDSGDFVFLYVGRDLDDRTQRIMRYLAEGPRMTFFAVEVDYYRDPGGDASTMVPRAAFVPSWVTEQRRPGRATSSAPALVLEDSPDVVRDLASRMDALAVDLDLVVTTAKSSRIYRPARNAGGVYLYLDGSRMEFDLDSAREHGDDVAAAALIDSMERVLHQRPRTGVWPQVKPESVLANWDAARAEVLEPYFEMRRRHVIRDGDARGLDIPALHALVPLIPAGRWTSYGDVSKVVGGHPKGLGSHVRSCRTGCAEAWRVLDADGRAVTGFLYLDPTEKRPPLDRLVAEGVAVTGGKADQGARLDADALRGLRSGRDV